MTPRQTIHLLVGLPGLLLTLAPSLLYFYGVIEHSTTKTLMLVGMILWFVAASVAALLQEGVRHAASDEG
ncbi:hypothetical protein [Mucisphaera calidilacus]|uniref:Uncharacterized protein n=1 Tax=Mucisphaera calidilacus TaxID=2527982 RepID=A0A518BWX0_9BACT|nr:hypothetical protein [Mucisphaera calidilacus]QDU71461.1 hypothetical protein Pan265_13110 [Mucisphaera calidilacus]